MTFWIKCETFPPIAVRLLARHRCGLMFSDAEVAAGSGLSVVMVRLIGQGQSWRGVDMPTMRAFLIGCEFDFESRKNMQRVTNYLRVLKSADVKWKYLLRSPAFRDYQEAAAAWINGQKKRTIK